MIRQSLNGTWKLKRTAQEYWLPASIPGTVYTDLLRNGEMEDPYFKDNEFQALKRMEDDYEYVCYLTPSEDLMSEPKKLLRFDGIDTIADIYLNGKKIGNAYNMHRIWEFDLSDALKHQENELIIILHSPTRYIRKAFQKSRTLGAPECMEGFVHIRKAHYMFGWDWGAHLPDCGIFRNVSLLGYQARIESVHVQQAHGKGLTALQISANVELNDFHADDVELEVVIHDPDGKEIIRQALSEGIVIHGPKLWWPRGYGEQPLYTVKLNLLLNGALQDAWERNIGLRTMGIRKEKDKWGESFAHEVNGVAIFAMGANYIPEDHLLGRTSLARTKRLLEDCVLANFNTIRVWGGGYYPDDWFFDLCDELGLIVWQDFMFACGMYDLTREFRENVTQEFIDNIKRIRHHACLGLWCGNNEMEMFVERGSEWVTKPSEVRDYLVLYEYLLPEVLHEYDPDTFYWPASPSSGGSFDEPNDFNRGDVHYWEVWHSNKPFSEFRNYHFRYLSEFGFQGFPCLNTIKTFTDDPDDWNPFSNVMERHQKNASANGKIMNYMQQTFLCPNGFELFLYASQLLQAQAIRYGVEHFRRNRGRCMGAIYWQLNDCWPVISWSSIDYAGRWKALHYYAKRFFAPLLLSCQEEGMMSQKVDLNLEHHEFEKSIQLNVANETMETQEATVFWSVRNANGTSVEDHEKAISVPPLTSLWLEKAMLPDIDPYCQYVSYCLCQGGQEVSAGTALLSYPKYFRFENPNLSYHVEGDEIILSASAYAMGVEIQNEMEDLILSDNYFDMNGGEKRVKALRGEFTGLRLRSVYDIK